MSEFFLTLSLRPLSLFQVSTRLHNDVSPRFCTHSLVRTLPVGSPTEVDKRTHDQPNEISSRPLALPRLSPLFTTSSRIATTLYYPCLYLSSSLPCREARVHALLVLTSVYRNILPPSTLCPTRPTRRLSLSPNSSSLYRSFIGPCTRGYVPLSVCPTR